VRMLGLDIGERRVGVALGDSRSRIATPLCVLEAPLSANVTGLESLVEEYSVKRLVIGLPLTLGGDEGPQARAVRLEAEELARLLPVETVFVDERLTSAQANRHMSACGVSQKKRRGSVDMVAAAILLQAYLDSKAIEEDANEC